MKINLLTQPALHAVVSVFSRNAFRTKNKIKQILGSMLLLFLLQVNVHGQAVTMQGDQYHQR